MMTSISSLADLTDSRRTASSNQYALPYVADPEGTFSDISRNEYLDRLNQSDQFERDQVNKALTDTSLIDAATESAKRAPELTRGIVARNQERYGVSLTPAQRLAQQNSITQNTTLGGLGAINQSRLDQQEQNTTSLSRLLSAANNSYSTAMGALGNASANAAKNAAAYKSAKAKNKADLITGVAGLAAKFI